MYQTYSVAVSACILALSVFASGHFCNISDVVCKRFKSMWRRSSRYSSAAVLDVFILLVAAGVVMVCQISVVGNALPPS
jgi:hypothetical protein